MKNGTWDRVFLSVFLVALAFAASAQSAETKSASPPTLQEQITLTPQEEALLAEAAKPVVPPSNNAAPIYCRIFQQMERDREKYFTKEKLEVVISDKPATKSGLPEPIPPLDYYDRTYGGDVSPYAEIRRAVGMQCDFTLDYARGMYTPLPHLAAMRNLARLMAFQARWDYEEGRYDRGIEDAGYIWTISRHAASEPAMVANLVGLAIDSIGRNVLMRMCFQRRGDREFLAAARKFLASQPDRLVDAPAVLRSDSMLMGSFYLHAINDPGLSGADVLSTLIYETADAGLGGGIQVVKPIRFTPEHLRNAVLREMLETSYNLPSGSLTEENVRATMKKIVARYLVSVHAYAEAVKKGPAAASAWRQDFEARNTGTERERMGVELLANMLTPGLFNFPRQAWLQEGKAKGSILVIDAFIRGDKKVELKDAFGVPYKATWGEDFVYFESPSQFAEAHDMDFSLPAYMKYDEFQKRLGAHAGASQVPSQKQVR